MTFHDCTTGPNDFITRRTHSWTSMKAAVSNRVDAETRMDGIFFTDSRGSGENDDHDHVKGALIRTARESSWKLFTRLHKHGFKFLNLIQMFWKVDIRNVLMENYLIYIIVIAVQLSMNQVPYIFTRFNSHHLMWHMFNGCLLDNIH